MIPPSPRRARRDNGQAAIILVGSLAVVALAFLSARVFSSHHPHSAPAAPLIGAVDRAKATTGAANDRIHQLENQIGGATNTTDPLAP